MFYFKYIFIEKMNLQTIVGGKDQKQKVFECNGYSVNMYGFGQKSQKTMPGPSSNYINQGGQIQTTNQPSIKIKKRQISLWQVSKA